MALLLWCIMLLSTVYFSIEGFLFFLLVCEWKWKSLSHVQLFATPWTVQWIYNTVYNIQYIHYCILEWIAFPFSRGSYQPRGQTQISCIAGKFFSNWAIGEACWFMSTLHILCETLISIGKSFPSLSFYIFFFQIKVFTFIDSLIAYMFSKAYPYYVTIFLKSLWISLRLHFYIKSVNSDLFLKYEGMVTHPLQLFWCAS